MCKTNTTNTTTTTTTTTTNNKNKNNNNKARSLKNAYALSFKTTLKLGRMHWATRWFTRSFARTAYSFAPVNCSLAPRSAAPSFVCSLTHSLPWSLPVPVQVQIWGTAHLKAHRYLIFLRHIIVECEKKWVISILWIILKIKCFSNVFLLSHLFINIPLPCSFLSHDLV